MVISALSIVGRPRHRRGTVLPLVALTIVAQLSFLALAIDLGMVAISKTQAQQAADLAALTAAQPEWIGGKQLQPERSHNERTESLEL